MLVATDTWLLKVKLLTKYVIVAVRESTLRENRENADLMNYETTIF